MIAIRKARAIAAVLALAAVPGSAQTIQGMALLGSYVPPGTLSASAGIWGWTSPSGREFALLTSRNPGGVSFVDITDPARPEEINFIKASGNSIWHEIHSYRNYAYKVSQQLADGLQVIDMAPLDQGRPAVLVGSPTTWFRTAHTLYVDTTVSPARLFVAYELTQGVMIFTLEDPANPKLVKTLSGEAHDMFARGDRLYVSNQFRSTLTIWDIADLQNPLRISSIDLDQVSRSRGEPGKGIAHNAWLSEDNRYLFTTEETAGTTVKAFDLAGISPTKPPALVGTYVGAEGIIPHNVYVKGTLLYVAHYTAGLRVVDISDPARMREIAFHRPSTSSEVFGGTWGAYPWFKSGSIIHGDDVHGLFIVKLDAAASAAPAAEMGKAAITPLPGGRFDLRPSGAGPYLLSLVSPSGREVLRLQGAAGGAKRTVTVPAGRLPAGRYLLSLRQGGRAESLPVFLGR